MIITFKTCHIFFTMQIRCIQYTLCTKYHDRALGTIGTCRESVLARPKELKLQSNSAHGQSINKSTLTVFVRLSLKKKDK